MPLWENKSDDESKLLKPICEVMIVRQLANQIVIGLNVHATFDTIGVAFHLRKLNPGPRHFLVRIGFFKFT